MTDNLSDRITRVLNRELLAQLPDALSGGDDLAPSPSGTINLQHLAAALIAELGLREERTKTETVTNEQGATWFRQGGYRYVGEWISDE